MAEVGGHVSKPVFFWTKTDMDSSTEDSDSYVPGVSLNRPGNLRPGMRGRKTPEVKTKIPLTRPMEDLPIEMLKEDVNNKMQADVGGSYRNHTRKLSFKDLRPEDKQRVANLIKELAKTGEEKEKVVNQLYEERQRYEHQILQLVEQQEQILNEREEIQRRFFDSQRLLNRYQGELLEEQGKQKPSIVKPATYPTWNIKQTDGRNSAGLGRQSPCVEQADDFNFKSVNGVQEVTTDLPVENIRRGHEEPFSTNRDMHLIQGTENLHVDNIENGYVETYTADRERYLGESEIPPSRRERPYTARIDKEIAELQCVTNSLPRTSDLIHVEPLVAYRPQRATRYPRNPVKSRPFRDPIMSSTQKSSVIEDISLTTINSEFHPLQRDDSSNSLSTERDFANGDRDHETRGLRNRVGFVEPTNAMFGDAKLHSPCLENTNANNDHAFIKYYKKLSPEERKQKLLEQKAALLEEQKRLKEILVLQEEQLCQKQQVLQRRHLERKKGLERQLRAFSPVSVTGKLVKSARDVHDEGDDECDPVDLNKATYIIDSDRESPLDELVKRLDYSGMSESSQNAREPVNVRSRISAGTSPIATTRITIGTSPLRMDRSNGSPSLERVDAGTSVSYRHISRTPPRLSPKQSNLPLRYDESDRDSPVVMRDSPIENGRSILEIVDSIQDGPASHNGSFDRPAQSSVERNDSFREQLLHNEDEDENFEESRILEEIFFLK